MYLYITLVCNVKSAQGSVKLGSDLTFQNSNIVHSSTVYSVDMKLVPSTANPSISNGTELYVHWNK